MLTDHPRATLLPYTTLFRSKSNGIRCEGVIISNNLVMTMKKCLTHHTGKILLWPTDIELVVGGVANLTPDNPKQVIYSLSPLVGRHLLANLPSIVLSDEEGN